MTGTLNFDILLRDHIDGYRRWAEMDGVKI